MEEMSGFCRVRGNSLARKMGRKMKKQILALMTLAMASGCCVLPEAIPPCERKGQLYCYTRHAFDGEERQVRLVWWALRPLKPMFGLPPFPPLLISFLMESWLMFICNQKL